MNIFNTKEYNSIGDKMIKKYSNILRIILPNKKTNIFIISILILGIITGSVFATIIGLNDKTLVIDKINLFINNINNNSLDTINVLKNSLSTNLLYVIIIFILGMTLIGIVFNIFLLFIKSFIIGFTLASFIITYSYKGLILSTLYIILGQLINIIVIIIITIYSIIFSMKLIKLIFKENTNLHINKYLKNYFLILIISIIMSIISSISETFLLPSIIKLIINIFI